MDERLTIKTYYDNGYSTSSIVKALKNLKIGERKIYRTIKRLTETGSVADRKRSGRPRSVRTPELVNKVKCRLWRNPVQSLRKMASQVYVSPRTLRRIVKEDLGLTSYKKRKVQALTQNQHAARLERSKALLERFGSQDLDMLVFSDEKLFSVEERYNSQNVRIYAASFEDIPEHMRTVQRFQAEKKIMVWCAVSKKGKFPMVFVEPGVKINAEYYKSNILENVVKPHGQLMFGDDNWTFQQDSAPAHKAITCQNWCEENLPDYISSKEWPPSSPDLNPLDYSIWGYLEARVNTKRHTSIESLKASLKKEWKDLPIEYLRTTIESWPNRLRAVIKQKGGRFE